MSPVRRRPITRRRPRRRVVWANQGWNFSVASTFTIVQDLLTEFRTAGHSVEGLTIMRMHIQLSFTPFPAGAIGAMPWGIIVCRQSDLGGPAVAQRPSPGNTADWELDWMVLRQDPPTYSGGTVDAMLNVAMDLKSRRKMHDFSQALAFTAYNPQTANVTVAGFTRTLVALP